MGSMSPSANASDRWAAPAALASTPWSCSSRARCVKGTVLRFLASRMRVERTRSARGPLLVPARDLAPMAGVAVDPPQQRLQLVLERGVALRAAEPPGLAERRVQEPAARALDATDPLLVRRRHGVHHAGEQIGDVE